MIFVIEESTAAEDGPAKGHPIHREVRHSTRLVLWIDG